MPTIAEIGGVTWASVAKVNGIARASIAKVDGMVGAFDPLSLSPALWFDAATISQLDNTDVDSWTDKISSIAASQTGTSRPKYRTGVVNGHPVVRFDGNNDYLTTPSGSIFSGSGGKSLFVVFKNVSTTGFYSIIGQGPNNSTNGDRLNFCLINSEVWAETRNSGVASDAVLTVGNHIAEFIYSSGTNVQDGKIFLDGQEYSKNLGSSATLSISNGPIVIGKMALTSVSDYLNGDIAEILYFQRELPAADRQSVESYLNSKYLIY